jgi:hypothetical protein
MEHRQPCAEVFVVCVMAFLLNPAGASAAAALRCS